MNKIFAPVNIKGETTANRSINWDLFWKILIYKLKFGFSKNLRSQVLFFYIFFVNKKTLRYLLKILSWLTLQTPYLDRNPIPFKKQSGS